MKRGTLEHPKMAALVSMLGVRRHVAAGLLEMMWHFTARYASQGDIGKHSDEIICANLDWPQKKAAALIRALVDCRWLDTHPTLRLLVHDWHEHSDGTCDKFLFDKKLSYANGAPTRRGMSRQVATSRDKSRPDDENGEAVATSRDLSRSRARVPKSESEPKSKEEHPDFAKLLKAADGHLDVIAWENWMIQLRGHGFAVDGGLTEAQVVEQLTPIVATANWSYADSRGVASWLGWQLADLAKRSVAFGKKTGAAAEIKKPAEQIPAGQM